MSTPDQLLETALQTEAVRLALEGGRIDEAVQVLRELAGGREDHRMLIGMTAPGGRQ